MSLACMGGEIFKSLTGVDRPRVVQADGAGPERSAERTAEEAKFARVLKAAGAKVE